MKIRRPEQLLQKACVVWLEVQRRMGRLTYFHVPNGTYKTKRMAWIMQGQGLRAGVPDLVICLPMGRTYFVELKARSGRVSDVQKAFHEELAKYGFEVFVIKDLDALVQVIEEKRRLK